MLLTVLVVLLACGCSSGLDCSITATPKSYRCFPSDYNGVSAVNSLVPGCITSSPQAQVECQYSVILGDGVLVPSPPDLTSEEYLRHFFAWQRGNQMPFIDFDLTNRAASTAIELSFLNSPANRISLPDIQLSEAQTINSDRDIGSAILDNQDLTQTDNQIRKISIRPSSPVQNAILRVTFQFTEFHDFDWFFLSEVRFCTEPYPLPTLTIMFQAPPSTIVQPSADDLRNGSTELVCTVSSQGYYTWQWRKDNTVIEKGSPNYGITIGDGSRTTKLTISNLDFSDAGQYRCSAILQRYDNSAFLAQTIHFPEIVSILPDLYRCGKNEETTMACELYGYQSSFSPPVWLNMDGSEITTSDKYTISSSDGVNTIVLENGTTLPSVVVSLTIHTLTPADEGDYTCRGVREESVTRLTAVEDTSSPSSPPQGVEQCEELPTSGVSVIVVLVIIIIALSATIFCLVVFIFKLKQTLNRTSTTNTNSVLQNDMAFSFENQSETNSIDTDAYETIPETTTRITKNVAYPRQNVWLPLEDRSTREQLPSHFEPMTEMDSDEENTQLEEASDYLTAVSLRSNQADMQNIMENDEQLERQGSDTHTGVDPFLLSVKEDGQLQELYLSRERGLDQEDGLDGEQQQKSEGEPWHHGNAPNEEDTDSDELETMIAAV